MRCILHHTPLNADGECLLCHLSSGALESRFTPGTEAWEEYMYHKSSAREIEQETIEQALESIVRSSRDKAEDKDPHA